MGCCFFLQREEFAGSLEKRMWKLEIDWRGWWREMRQRLPRGRAKSLDLQLLLHTSDIYLRSDDLRHQPKLCRKNNPLPLHGKGPSMQRSSKFESSHVTPPGILSVFFTREFSYLCLPEYCRCEKWGENKEGSSGGRKKGGVGSVISLSFSWERLLYGWSF